jgi:putative cell wall-binding protein
VARAIHALTGDGFAEQAFVVRGDMFPDAVSVAAPAYAQQMPVLLVRPDSAPESVELAVDDIGIARVFVAGGQQAVSSGALEEIGRPFTRATGSDRYATSVAVAELALDRSWCDGAYVGVASGEQFPDALSGGSAIGSHAGVVVLSRSQGLPTAVGEYVSDHAEGLAELWVIGGERALSVSVVDDLEEAAR